MKEESEGIFVKENRMGFGRKKRRYRMICEFFFTKIFMYLNL